MRVAVAVADGAVPSTTCTPHHTMPHFNGSPFT